MVSLWKILGRLRGFCSTEFWELWESIKRDPRRSFRERRREPLNTRIGEWWHFWHVIKKEAQGNLMRPKARESWGRGSVYFGNSETHKN